MRILRTIHHDDSEDNPYIPPRVTGSSGPVPSGGDNPINVPPRVTESSGPVPSWGDNPINVAPRVTGSSGPVPSYGDNPINAPPRVKSSAVVQHTDGRQLNPDLCNEEKKRNVTGIINK